MDLRSSCALVALLLMTACTDMEGAATGAAVAAPPLRPAIPPGPPRVAILLPLTGPRAEIGKSMLQAAQLALSAPGSPILDIKDTGGDPARAAQATQDAVNAGDRLILGPLTAEETQAATGPASAASLPVLAFTSDPAAAAPGVWTLGLTPGQQMRRLVAAAREDGRTHIAAILPQGALGDALQTALAQAASDAGMEAPTIERNDPGLDGFTTALKTISNYESRRGELESRIKSLRTQTDPDSRQQAAQLAAKPVAPPPFDALLIGESGDTLLQGAEVLSFYDVVQPQVRVLGPAIWAQQSHQLSRLAGAWYAALDPANRAEFAEAYQGKFGAPPKPFADYAFDAAAVARALATEGDFSAHALTRPEGFTGVDGALALLPDGHVHRALAVWQVLAGGGAKIVSPAPTELPQTGS
jgi:ABC-type branched-subunit amino acid transport system substrate-binding protein